MAVLEALAERLNDALPQTQCMRCGFPDCASYAHAIANGEAAINQCPPGGAQGVARLAAITGQPSLPLNPLHGQEGPRNVAVIDEAWCIGCTLCLPVCPTDAIVGSNKQMHTVIEAHCTGCELCIPVCPVDCISLGNVSGSATGWQAWSPSLADAAKERYARHVTRIEKTDTAIAQRREEKAKTEQADLVQHSLPPEPVMVDPKRALIEAALARARALKAAGSA